jgi:acyl carrier protein
MQRLVSDTSRYTHRQIIGSPDQVCHTATSTDKEKTVDPELFARFRKCAVEVLSVEESAVVPEANFGDDLDADSLDLVELVMALEEEFDVSVPEEELEGVETVQQAYDIVAAKL